MFRDHNEILIMTIIIVIIRNQGSEKGSPGFRV